MKKITKNTFLCLVFIVLLVFGAVACGGESAKVTLTMPKEATVEVGTSFVLTPEISGETQDKIEWTSGDTSIATVNDGVVVGVAAGVTTITAKLGGAEAVCTVTVKESVVVTVDPVTKQMVEGNVAKLVAVVKGSTEKAVWRSSDDTVVAVDEDGNVRALKEGTATVSASVGDKTAICEITVLGIKISFGSETVNVYTGSEGYTIEVTVQNGDASKVEWSSDNEKVATVNGQGVVTAVAEGKANITAKIGEKSAVCVVNVLTPTIALPESVNLYKTKTLKLTADTGDCTLPIEWKSQNEAIVGVSAEGVLTAVGVGETTVTATVGKVSATVRVTVKEVPVLALDKTALVLDKGGVTAEAEGTLVLTADGVVVTEIEWSSDAASVATAEDGIVRAVGAGKATVTANYFGFEIACAVEVKDFSGYLLVRTAAQFDRAIHPKGTNTVTQNIVLGNDIDMGGADLSYNPYNLNAIIDGNGYTVSNFTVGCNSLRSYIDYNIWNGNLNKALFWDILSGGVIRNIAMKNVVAYFGSGCGVLAIKNLGTIENVLIEVELNNRDWATERVGGLVGTVSGGKISNCIVVAKAFTQEEMREKTLKELGTAYGDGAFSKGYDGSDFPERGVASQGILVGRTDGGVVENCIAVSKDSDPDNDIFGGNLYGTKSAEGAGKNCALKTDDELKDPATFGTEWDRSVWQFEEGVAPALKNEGKVAPVIVEFLDFGGVFTDNKAKITAVVNRSESIVYASRNENVATVDENGVITAIAPGKAVITATSAGVTAETEIEVDFVFVNAAPVRVKKGERVTLQYACLNPDLTLEWSSDNEDVAMVENGVVAAKNDGNVVITVRMGEKIVKLTTITVYSVKIALDAEEKSVYIGNEFTLNASVENADVSEIVWKSDAKDVATVENGIVKGISAGVAHITATVDGVTATCAVTVKAVADFRLDQNVLNLDVGGIVRGKNATLTAFAEPEVPVSVTWRSGNEQVATVENGVVTATGAGKTTIFAEVNGAAVECEVIVKDYTGYIAVNDEASFRAIKNNTAAKYVLTADITLGGAYLDNLGNLTGILDGNGHKVSDFILGAKSLKEWLSLGEFSWDQKLWQGLFSGISGGTVRNLSLTGVTAFFSNCCGVVTASNFGTIENVFVEVALYNRGWATRNVGGIAGECGTYEGNTGVIRNCIVIASSKTNAEMQEWIMRETGKEDKSRGFCKGYDGDDLPDDGLRSQGLIVGRLGGDATVENCFAVSKESDPDLDIFNGNLFGVKFKQGVDCALKTEEELKTSALYGQKWDSLVWRTEEGKLPELRVW